MDRLHEHIVTNLYDTYAQDIFRYLVVRIGNRERAQDIVQEVFIRAWRHVHGGGELTEPRAFLYTIAHNLYVNDVTRTKPQVSLDDLSESGFDIPDPGNDVDTMTSVEHQAEILKRIESLPDTYREIFILRFTVGLSIKEIAERLKISDNVVSVRIHRGIEYLQEHFDWHEFE